LLPWMAWKNRSKRVAGFGRSTGGFRRDYASKVAMDGLHGLDAVNNIMTVLSNSKCGASF
jgi:hypothetical protein